MDGEMGTREKLLFFGKQEFLHKGFQKASLRGIASAAGLTTGAIYTCFADKNALFEAIVSPVCAQVERMFDELSASYCTPRGAAGELSKERAAADLKTVYGFIYANFDVFRLLVSGAEGSSRADYVHTVVEYEVAHTLAYLERMKEETGRDTALSRTFVHTVSESYINAVLEPVRHNRRYEEAIAELEQLCVFYAGGWNSIFQALFGG
ncbi:MAG TPA: TetR/AcrR family transcriptional regulator [Terriglobales bacterium]|nr:TetR/AcrR family transcriptional regulator [Terriglobales bacterium]